MSSLAAARADNYYYPKEWTPEMGGINKFHNSHPLGVRAKDLKSKGILVVRFEMPFNVWCTSCNTHIGRGVRYNAKKKKIGSYFTTPLWQFALTCASCQGEMIIHTDPQNYGYKLVSGIRKKIEEFTAKDVETEKINAPNVRIEKERDPFFRLEHDEEDKKAAKKRSSGFSNLLRRQELCHKDPYSMSASLRSSFRKEKKKIQKRQKVADKLGLDLELLPLQHEDFIKTKQVFKKKRNSLLKATKGKLLLDSSKRRSIPLKGWDEKRFENFGV